MLPLTKVEQFIRKHLRYNVTVGLLDGGMFGAAVGFASFGTILPLFVASMTNSATLIGLVPAIHSTGWLLPQLFTARYTSRLRRYKRTVLLMTIHERIPFLGLALVAFLLPKIGIHVGLILTFMLLTWQGLGGGFTANSWTSMISKIIPPEVARDVLWNPGRRGEPLHQRRRNRSRLSFGLARLPVELYDLFLIACVFFTISWCFLSMTREPADHEKVIDEHPAPFWQGAGKILQRDKNFNWFLTRAHPLAICDHGVFVLHRLRVAPLPDGYSDSRLSHRDPDHRADGCQRRHGLAGRPCRSSADVDHRRRLCHPQFPAGVVCSIARLVLSNFCACRFCKCCHLDKWYDDDRGFQRRKRTTHFISVSPKRLQRLPRSWRRSSAAGSQTRRVLSLPLRGPPCYRSGCWQSLSFLSKNHVNSPATNIQSVVLPEASPTDGTSSL